MSSARRPLSRSSTATTIASDDASSVSDDASNEVPYARRRASNHQLQALHKVFVSKPYPTREERNELANEIGMEYKAVTIWFQNKRQSSKRKAWTKNSRAKKRAEARQPATPAGPAVPLKSTVSLDHIASLSERSMHPPYSPSTPRPPLTPRKASSRVAFGPVTPQSRSDLWRYMPSSPPDHPSSPYADFLPASTSPSRAKSLEWACAKARLDHKQPRGKENRPPKPCPPSNRRQKKRPTITDTAHVVETDVKIKTKVESSEDVIPSTNALSRDSSVRDESALSPRTVSSRNAPPGEFEAAMILLQLSWKGKD